MPPAASEIMLAMLRAQIKGIVNGLPMKLKFVFRGDAFAFTNPSPTVSCHQGTKSETAIKTNIVMPPLNPNQFIFILFNMLIHLLLGQWDC